MIAYIINGKSFGNCVDYVTRRALEEKLFDQTSRQQKSAERKYEANNGDDILNHLSKDWDLIGASSDIRLYDGRKAIAEDISRPTKLRKPIESPVGHISLDFHPDDAPTMTDERMAEIAVSYMQQMGLLNTPFIIVRHHDKKHPHCHLVFSRVDYDGKILSQTTNFKRNERVCKALNKKFRLVQGKSKLNTDVSKLRGKEKVRYKLTQDIARAFVSPNVSDWDSFLIELQKNGITAKEKVSKSGNINLYYCVGRQSFWYRKLDTYLSRENLEKVFRERLEYRLKASQSIVERAKCQSNDQSNPPTQKPQQPLQSSQKMQPKPQKPIVIPPLPDNFMGGRISLLNQDRYQKGEVISVYICPPGQIIGRTHWVWYDFTANKPRCELEMPGSDRYIPEAFKLQQSAKSTSGIQQSSGVRFSHSSLSRSPQEEQGFALGGGGISDDFKHFLEKHPGMSYEEALHKFKEEQKAKARRRQGPKLH